MRGLRDARLAEEGTARTKDELALRLAAAATQAAEVGETMQAVAVQMLLNFRLRGLRLRIVRWPGVLGHDDGWGRHRGNRSIRVGHLTRVLGAHQTRDNAQPNDQSQYGAAERPGIHGNSLLPNSFRGLLEEADGDLPATPIAQA
jgi:hypothetical protein